MKTSAAKSVPQYLADLPEDRREVVAAMRALILENLPSGYEEAINWGMICYQIPLSRYPDTYNRQPLGYVCLAAQKNGYSLYLTGPYMHGEEAESRFRDAFTRAGKKLDMGKSCVRFRRMEDLALDVLAKEIASTGVDEYVKRYEELRKPAGSATRSAAKRTGPLKPRSSDAGKTERPPSGSVTPRRGKAGGGEKRATPAAAGSQRKTPAPADGPRKAPAEAAGRRTTAEPTAVDSARSRTATRKPAGGKSPRGSSRSGRR